MLAVAAVLASFAAAALGFPPVFAQEEGAVSGLTLTSDAPGTLAMSWDVPDQTPTDYRVNWAKSAEDFPSYTESDGNAYPTTNSHTVTGLDEGVEYKVRVRARYRGDQLTEGQNPWATPWSEAARITIASQTTDPTPEPAPSPPGAPAGLTGTASHDEVELTWNDPRDTSITSYQILRWQRGVHDPGDFQVYVDDTGSAGTSYTDTDVEAEARYVYRIKARNAGGLSARSNYFNAVLPAAPAVPNAPTGLTSSNTYIAIVLSWDDPGDDSVTGYQVLRRDRSDADSQFEVLADDTATTDTSYTDGNIAPKAEYEYQVKARNEHGLSAAGAAHSVDVPADPDAITTGAIDLGDLTAVTEARSPEYEINGYGDRLDYFRFTLTEPRQVSLELREMDFDADLLLFKDNTSFTLLGESRNDGTADEAITETLLDGSYLVLVTAEEEGDNSYALTHGTADPDADRVAELREEENADNPPTLIEPQSAQAQGDVTLVSNTGETAGVPVELVDGVKYANKFKAGSHTKGYIIESVSILWHSQAGNVGDVTVTIDGGGGTDPGATISTLTNPDSLVNGENIFTIDGSLTLDPNTYYFVTVSASGDVGRTSRTDSDSQTGVAGWEIADSARKAQGNNWSANHRAMTFSVRGQIIGAATGAPTISGTPAVSQTLTADTSGISDPDGLTNVSYSYQWIRVDGNDETDIAGADSSAYTLVDDDEGKSVKVRVDFQDDEGTQESLTSEKFPDDGTIYTAVELLRVGVRPTRVELRYAEELLGEDPPTGAFSISINGEPAVNPTRTRVGGEIFTVLLELPTPISQDDSVTVSYTPPTDNPIRDLNNNPALGFTSLDAVDITGTWDGVIRVNMERAAYQVTEPRDGQVEVTVGIVTRSPVLEFDLPPDLRFWVEIRTHGDTAKSGEDFVPVESRRVEIIGASPSYTTLLVNADGLMEGRSENFGVELTGTFGGGAADARIDTTRSFVTIADINKASLEVIATPARVLEGQTKDVTLEIRATDDDGSSSDECQIAIPTDNIRLTVETDATSDDYAYTVTEGNLNDIDLPACGSATVKLRLEAKSDSDAQEFEEDINFRILLRSSIDDRVQRKLLRSARVVIADPTLSNDTCEHERVVWCADLTTGSIYSGDNRIGTGFLDDRATQVGSLSPSRFSYQSIAFALKMLDLGYGALSTVEVLLRPYPVGVFGRNHKLHVGNRGVSLQRRRIQGRNRHIHMAPAGRQPLFGPAASHRHIP